MSTYDPTDFVPDDDPAIRDSLLALLQVKVSSPSGRGRASGEGEGEADVGVAPQVASDGNAPPPGRYRVRPPPLRGRGDGA